MSKYIDDIIDCLDKQPRSWDLIDPINDTKAREHLTRFGGLYGVGIESGDVRIINHYNPAFMALDQVYIRNTQMPMSYIDTYRIHKAVSRWFKNISADHLVFGTPISFK